ncbi:hypothetical protein DKT77_04380 [Meridianimarinicoccus roseus]|uniref:Cell division and transport-associated protein TolA n=1 Tax=Meridianimarinicoccus roseus TaxID=2072018 RepID=A0A2V2LR53_9RHOB|nr:hypothetical protein [Meridianimarinicoccus roseus]PWR03953.1 hypothetical protein DKT77_04380 [Meridianimarinicoccus roseus]
MDTGFKVSLGGHAALLAVALVGWPFSAPRDAAPPASVSVTLVSPSDLPSVGGLTPPAAPEIAEEFAALPPPAREDAPRPPAQPDAPPVAEDTPPPPEPPAPEAPPPPVDRVAPVPQPAPPEPVREGDRVQPEIAATPDPAPDAIDAEEQQATAPEAAAPQIVTEATETTEAPTLAPAPAPRPQARPNRPAPEVAEVQQPVREPDPEPMPEPEPSAPPQTEQVQDAVAAALAEALGAQTQSAVPSGQAGGPPLSQGERDGLRVAVSRCWNFGALSTDAAKVTVVVGMDMGLDGSPSNLRLVSQSGGSAAAAQQAYDTARRAILRCQPFSLPPEKYEQWRTIEMTFNPEEMRRR